MAMANYGAGKSRQVSSNQHGPHVRLKACVQGHYANAWCEPLHQASVSAFDALQELLEPAEQRRLVLDLGCGTGQSTVELAKLHPARIVIGVDRSEIRLHELPSGQLASRRGNCIWIRARLETFWRLVYGADWDVEKQYLLYPNPWPKSAQLKKRWHGHPVFPIVLAVCGNIELRCNWQIYAEEFARVVAWSGGNKAETELFSPEIPISPFERKYAASGHQLYRVCTGSRA